jgi:2-polyprenyl-3-methyl-5-hydroxy-6-metoxy-1,4-benzoquinol methylase
MRDGSRQGGPPDAGARVDGRLWGARASDWADIQEGTVRPVYAAVLARTRVTSGTRYLDIGCGAGMAAPIAAARGAQVSGIDAAETLLGDSDLLWGRG